MSIQNIGDPRMSLMAIVNDNASSLPDRITLMPLGVIRRLLHFL